METLYDHLFSTEGIGGRVYLMKNGETRYVIRSFSIEENTMKIFTGVPGVAPHDEKILHHLHDEHILSLTEKELEVLARAVG